MYSVIVSLDLNDTVPVHISGCKYLRFMWKGKMFEFTSLPFRLAPAPLIFTKLLRPVVAFLRWMGIRIMINLDDNLIMAPFLEDVSGKLQTVLQILTHLGFVINRKKCFFVPTQVIEFLGFIVDFTRMVLCLPRDKVCKIKKDAGTWQIRPRLQVVHWLI